MALSDKQIKIAVIGFVGTILFLILIPSVIVIVFGESHKVTQQCLSKTDKTMDDFRSAIEKTVLSKQPSTVSFNPQGCNENESFVLMKSDSLETCQRSCLSNSSVCTLLMYSSDEVTGIYPKCVNIPYDTLFNYSNCEEIDGYHLIKSDFTEKLEKGNYRFTYADAPNFPIVCAYFEN